MVTHNLTKTTKVTRIGGGDVNIASDKSFVINTDPINDPPCANYQDTVYKNKPFEQGALFLLAEIRQLLKKIDEK